MAVHSKIEYTSLERLHLDPENPRLGRESTKQDLSEPKILELMKDWALEELALSFLESGYWPQEALIVFKQTVAGRERLVVVEGNRRLAALKLLKLAFDGKATSKKWDDLIAGQADDHRSDCSPGIDGRCCRHTIPGGSDRWRDPRRASGAS